MRKDIYEKWKEDGILDKKLRIIKRYYSYQDADELIYHQLGISESTWERLKKKYPDIKLAMTDSKKLHEQILLVNLTNRARDRFYEETSSVVEDYNGKQKKRFTKNKKFVPADFGANKYLLAKLHNVKYHDNYEMIKIAKKRENNKNEDWSNFNNENNND